MYPYIDFTKEGVREALKRECKTDSPVVVGTFSLVSANGTLGGKAKGEFHFLTEDSKGYRKEYRITVVGTTDPDDDSPYGIRYNWEKITSIKEITRY